MWGCESGAGGRKEEKKEVGKNASVVGGCQISCPASGDTLLSPPDR